MAQILARENNASNGLRVLMDAIERIAAEMSRSVVGNNLRVEEQADEPV